MKTNIGAKQKNIVDELLGSISPVEQSKTDTRMILAAKIADAMKAKNWKNKDLLEAAGKDNPSIITKWLSGTHNFTVDTLVELENALDVKLLDLGQKRELIQVFIAHVRNKANDLQYADQLSATKITNESIPFNSYSFKL